MKIHNPHQRAETSGITNASAFGFEMNAKMQDILMSKMYKNKPGAIIRELSANAWDAHVEAGNSDKPFEIGLPTWLDKSFYIRDFGTGIPHDLFTHVYTNIGASTKEDTDDLIGGFGLGSKTPFTMTDTFMVENWNSGTKTTWMCYKDQGNPQVVEVGREPSDEPSGLKVSFTFDEGDVKAFTNEITKQLKYFPVKPEVHGGEDAITFDPMPDDWDTKNYFFTDDSASYSWQRKHYAVMGNVAYELHPDNFDIGGLKALFNRSLTLKFPIGTLDIPPSRESLEYTERTKKAIRERLQIIKQEYQKDFDAKLKGCVTWWETCILLHDANRGILDVPTDFTFDGQIHQFIRYTTSFKNIKGYTLYHLDTSYKKRMRTTILGFREAKLGAFNFYVNDLGKGYHRHINELSSSIINTMKKNYIVHPKDTSVKGKDASVQEAILTIEGETGKKPLLLSSVLGFPVKTKATKRAAVDQIFTLGAQGNSVASSVVAYTGDLPTKGYYVEIKGWKPENSPVLPLDLLRLVNAGLEEFLGKPVYLIRTKTIKDLPNGVERLTQAHLDQVKAKVEPKALQNAANIAKFNQLPSIHLKGELPFLKDKKALTYIRYRRICKIPQQSPELRVYEKLTSRLTITLTPLSPKVKDLVDHWNENYKPLLDDLLWTTSRHDKYVPLLTNVITLNQ